MDGRGRTLPCPLSCSQDVSGTIGTQSPWKLPRYCCWELQNGGVGTVLFCWTWDLVESCWEHSVFIFPPWPMMFSFLKDEGVSRMKFAQVDTDPSVSVMGRHPLLRPCCVSATPGQHGGCSLLCAVTSLHGGPTCQGHPLCAALWHTHCGSDSGAALYLFQAQCCVSTGGQQGALREQDGADWTMGRVLTLRSTWIRSWYYVANCSLDSAPAH